MLSENFTSCPKEIFCAFYDHDKRRSILDPFNPLQNMYARVVVLKPKARRKKSLSTEAILKHRK